ncbi:Eukaryotic aspartyl protease family protein [Euphorbia peplus]|nr:Eukaryotic aspartyl protease family protein [Euphorbia peplus]
MSPFFYLIILLPFVHTKPPNGFSLELIHKDSPLSPLYPGHLSDVERANRLAELSNVRAKTFEGSSINTQGMRLKLTHDGGLHLVKVQIGTPSISLYLELDTGSNLVWTQCEPCTRKYRQIPPIYNSTASRTFKKLPCEHPFCRNNSPFFKCQQGECVYRQSYLDGGVTEGVAASDALEPLNNAHVLLYFGCSRNTQNFGSFEITGRSGGILGLGLSPLSLVQQLSNITNHKFSYCLTPLDGGANASSLLRFGSDISTRGTFQSTPIVSPSNAKSYYLDLRDISVEGTRIGFPPNTFAIKRDGSGGCHLDSGTPLTRIIASAHPRVIGAFQNYFHRYGVQPIHLAGVRYDVCYKNNRAIAKLPSMTFHFQGADMKVEAKNLFTNLGSQDAFCLALQSSQQTTIIGAVQQVNTRFITM